MKKRSILIAILAALVVVTCAIPAMAEEELSGNYNFEKPGQRDILLANFKAASSLMLSKRAYLGLSGKQIDEIKQLSVMVKKYVITADAKIRTLKVDINTLSWAAPLNLEETNALLAESHELFKERGKFLLKSINELHSILNKEQLEKFNELA